MAQIGETLHDEINLQQVSFETCLFGLLIREGISLKEHLDEQNSILMELHDIDVKMEDKDLAMILLSFLPPPMKVL